MASAQATEVFNCSPDQFFDIISDYEKYDEFLQEVKSCTVLKEDGGRKLVEFKVSVVKSFSYTLWMEEERPRKVSWDFAGGDIFKTLHGSWNLEEEAGKTRATYAVDAKFGVFVPGPIAKALVGVNLPGMMSAYHKRVGEIYGG